MFSRSVICIASLYSMLAITPLFGGEIVGTEAERELLYPNIVPPRVVIGGLGMAPAQFLDITDVEFGSDTSFYVSDCSNNRVQEFSTDGHLRLSVGVPCPTNITADGGLLGVFSDKTDTITTVDPQSGKVLNTWSVDSPNISSIVLANANIYAMNKNGGELLVYGTDGKLNARLEVPKFSRVSDIAFDRGNIIVADKYSAQLVELNLGGDEVRRFGAYGTFPGELANPHGVSAANGRIVVADTVNHRLQEFGADGKFHLQWGRHPISPQDMSHGRMHYPHNVAISDNGINLVVCQPFEAKCDIFLTADIAAKYSSSDDSSYWDKFFWFHYRGPSRIENISFYRDPIDAPYIFMGEEDIHRIVIAKLKDGTPETLTYFGEYGDGEGQFKGPEGVFPGPNGNVYVVDTGNNRVQVFDLEGKFKFQFGKLGTGPGEFNEPGQGAAAKNGNIYISDSANKRIQVFDENGKFLLQFGQPGNGPGQFNRPIDAFVDKKNNRILVTDLYNARISVFDMDGTHISDFGSEGTDIGQFLAPHSAIYDDATDSIFVSDMVANNIQKFTSDGKFVGRYGRYGMALGEFKTPAGIGSIDGILIVMDHTNHRGQILNASTGTALLTFGESVIGIPNDVLVARKRLDELEAQIKSLSSKPEAVSKADVNDLAKQVDDIKKEMAVPSILQLDHH